MSAADNPGQSPTISQPLTETADKSATGDSATTPSAHNNIVWNLDLIRRYDLAGPRYTSYPTAPQFQDSFTQTELEAAIARSNQANRPLSLYFHIPFCNTVCYYCACNKIITANTSHARPYLDTLYQEMAMMAPRIDTERTVDQLHWGGGTPTFISDDEKRELMATTRRHFNLRDDDSGEYSIEVHPGRMSVETISVLRELGFNRLSMGVQDFHPDVQKAVNRFNTVEQVGALIAQSRKDGFHSISMDLIYGLPLQTLDTFKQTLKQVIELSPDRLSVFNYAHMPHLFKTQRQINESDLPSAQEKLLMLEQIITLLTEAGYCYIGMDHFAKPDDELAVAQRNGNLQRNFQGYSTHGHCDLFAFGLSSISAIDNIFVQNHKDIRTYTEVITDNQLPMAKGIVLTQDDLLRQTVIRQLICQFELTIADIEQAYNIEFATYFAPELAILKTMEKDGLLHCNAERIRITPEGRLLIRRICMVFDAYINQSAQVRYSRII